ncbi:MAG: hypothetical protein J5702_06260 [Bacteroidales bacterium]|nr:hypothetical protein [Bacteroidales bacterium]
MKKIRNTMAVVLAVAMLMSSCGMIASDSEEPEEQLVLTKAAEGTESPVSLQFSKVRYDADPADVPGCRGIIASTSGKQVDNSLWLTIYFYDDTAIGQELKLERIHFSAPLSSNSNNYTSAFTGKIILKEKNNKKAVLRMQDVHFKIAVGEYILNGDLVATR